MQEKMDELSGFYRGLACSFKKSFFQGVRYIRTDSKNVFLRDTTFKSLEDFAVYEGNHEFQIGERLYYISVARKTDGKMLIAFNGHHTIADAVVQEAISKYFLTAILEKKYLSLDNFRSQPTFTLSKSKRTSISDSLRFVYRFLIDYMSPFRKLKESSTSKSTSLYRISIKKQPGLDKASKKVNSILCGAYMKAFGEVLGFKNKSLKSINMVNVRASDFDRKSRDFVSSQVSAFTVNQRINKPIKEIVAINQQKLADNFKYSIAHLTSDLQFYFFRVVNFFRLGTC